MDYLRICNWFKPLLALVWSVSVITIMVLLVGCKTTYSAQYVNPDTGATTTMDVGTYREFPGGIKIWYDRTTGTFTLEAGEVTNGGDVEAARDIILGVLPLIQPAKGAGG